MGPEEVSTAAAGTVMCVLVPVSLVSGQEPQPQVALAWRAGEQQGRSQPLHPHPGQGKLRFEIPVSALHGVPVTLRAITWPTDQGVISVLWERTYWPYLEGGVPRLLHRQLAPANTGTRDGRGIVSAVGGREDAGDVPILQEILVRETGISS
jgi:hypothetical protein